VIEEKRKKKKKDQTAQKRYTAIIVHTWTFLIEKWAKVGEKPFEAHSLARTHSYMPPWFPVLKSFNRSSGFESAVG
jgi:hypothetical protein